MAPVTKSKRDIKKEENQKDIKHLLGEVMDFYPDETFCKIFFKEDKNSIQIIIGMHKEELKELKRREKMVISPS